MDSVTSYVESMVLSYLGPCKNGKLVVDGSEILISKCPQHVIENVVIKDNFCYIIEDTLRSHHEQFNCSSVSLLAMWFFWNQEFSVIMQEGYKITDIIKHSQSILNNTITLIQKITINLKESFLDPHTLSRAKHSIHKLPPSNRMTVSSPSFRSSKNCMSIIPAGIRYSSRHYSPVQENLSQVEDSELSQDNSIQMNDGLKRSLGALVRKLSHNDPECAKLVTDLWIRQISSTGAWRFFNDGIIVIPLTLSSSYTSIVHGLIVKAKSFSWYNANLFADFKTLILKGSVTFEYVHLGYNLKAKTSRRLNTDEILISQREDWLKKCCELLLELQVNVLLVPGTIDTDVALFCSSHGILVLSDIPWSQLETLCLTLKISPCKYLLDCDNKNIVSNVKVHQWKLDCDKANEDHQFFQICADNLTGIVPPLTVILCHPSSAYLKCQQHQLSHLMSRLHLATSSNTLLPGGGDTEKWCCRLNETFSFDEEIKTKIGSAIANGFQRYYDLVCQKLQLKGDGDDSGAFDELHSKVQAWRSALALVLMALQCDMLLINEPDNANITKLDLPLFGFL